jgi:hypothetical protein
LERVADLHAVGKSRVFETYRDVAMTPKEVAKPWAQSQLRASRMLVQQRAHAVAALRNVVNSAALFVPLFLKISMNAVSI